jgi:RIO kinase 1
MSSVKVNEQFDDANEEKPVEVKELEMADDVMGSDEDDELEEEEENIALPKDVEEGWQSALSSGQVRLDVLETTEGSVGDEIKLSHVASSSLRAAERSGQQWHLSGAGSAGTGGGGGGGRKARGREREERATVEQVLDPRTRMVLWRMLNNGTLNEINGCLSTGKEANVYHAVVSEQFLQTLCANKLRREQRKLDKEQQQQQRAKAGDVDGDANDNDASESPKTTKSGAPKAAKGSAAKKGGGDRRDQVIQLAEDEAMPFGDEIAIKVYKTSILVFKDRDRYVTGEFRFRRGYSRTNPRKMVKVWAEKELRNLLRLRNAGIPCPRPYLLRTHVLLMEFIGRKGWPAPKLKDAQLSDKRLASAYTQVVKMMRVMYRECKLVHADLSEYNMLYYKRRVYIIDVSQAVEHEHPNALEFLRMDCTNVTNFFKSRKMRVMTPRELFDFVTDVGLADERIDEYLDTMNELVNSRSTVRTADEQVDDAVWKQVFIPRTLDEIPDIERDLVRAADGDTDGIYYDKVIGLSKDLTAPRGVPELLQQGNDDNDDDDDDDDDDNDDDGDDGDDGEWLERPAKLTREEIRAARRANKQAVKEENRERRQTKIPKYVKKRQQRLTKGNKRKKR